MGRQTWVFTLTWRAWKEAGFQHDEEHLKKRNTCASHGQQDSTSHGWQSHVGTDRQAGTGRGQALGFCLWPGESNSCGLGG